MFSNWFSEKHAAQLTSNPSVQAPGPASETKESNAPAPGPSTVSSTSGRDEPIPLSSHDAALESTLSKLQDLRVSTAIENEHRQVSGASDSLPKNLYDPFDGEPVGLLLTEATAKANSEIWDHLANVRDLQSDIARMHARMEGLGDVDRATTNKQVASEDEGLSAEEEAKAAQSAEFARLSDRFAQRKDAVEQIMLKLETLSQSINHFHTTRAPLFRGKPLFNEGDHDVALQPEKAAIDRLKPTLEEGVFKDSPESVGRSLVDSDAP